MVRGEQGTALRHVEAAFRGRDDRQPFGPAIARTVSEPHGRCRRGGFCTPGRTSRPDGHPHVPVRLAGRACRRRRVSSDVPGARPAGRFALGARLARALAFSGGRSGIRLGTRLGEIRRRRLEQRKASQTEILGVRSRSRRSESGHSPGACPTPGTVPCRRGPLLHRRTLTQQQAARQLGWPLGTLQSRLARGREQLRAKLTRRGIAPSGALLAALLSSESAHAALPAALANSTVRMAVQYASAKPGSP